MVRGGRIAVAAASALAVLAVPAASHALAPPNPHDPCSAAGRDSCGTLGVGFYKRYRYGMRWFGDFHGAVAGAAHAFCIDLGYWYASRSYRYRLQSTSVLRDRAGKVVAPEHREEIAYAIWRYGQSTMPRRQAAVMLYIHSRMGDARRGEVDPAGVSPAVAALYRRVARDTQRYHGPYRIETGLSRTLTVDRSVSATIRIVSARGVALPHVRLRLTPAGATASATRVETSSAGVARVEVTPTAVSGLQLRLTTEPLAASEPRVFAPTAAAAVANGQRLAVMSAANVVDTLSRSDIHAVPQLATRASAQLTAPGTRLSDTVTVSGLGGASARIRVQLFGPFASREGIRCSGSPLWSGTFVAHGNGTAATERVRLPRAGFYAYREQLIGSAHVAGTTTPCALEAETALAAPKIITGRGDIAAPARAASAGAPTPVRLRLPALGIDAHVFPSAIDVAHGVLGVPVNVHRIGWWRDGMAPGASRGTILLAGHVDSASAGRGAFFKLGHARRGELVHVATAAGHSYTYRIVSVRSYLKTALPIDVFSREGRARLVLVTCGGRFDTATRHYRDNIVVIALPVS